MHPHLLDIFGDPDAGAGLEQPAEIGGAEGGQGGQGFQGDGLGKVLLNIIEHAVEGGHLPLRNRAAAFLYPGLAENAR